MSMESITVAPIKLLPIEALTTGPGNVVCTNKLITFSQDRAIIAKLVFSNGTEFTIPYSTAFNYIVLNHSTLEMIVDMFGIGDPSSPTAILTTSVVPRCPKCNSPTVPSVSHNDVHHCCNLSCPTYTSSQLQQMFSSIGYIGYSTTAPSPCAAIPIENRALLANHLLTNCTPIEVLDFLRVPKDRTSIYTAGNYLFGSPGGMLAAIDLLFAKMSPNNQQVNDELLTLKHILDVNLHWLPLKP